LVRGPDGRIRSIRQGSGGQVDGSSQGADVGEETGAIAPADPGQGPAGAEGNPAPAAGATTEGQAPELRAEEESENVGTLSLDDLTSDDDDDEVAPAPRRRGPGRPKSKGKKRSHHAASGGSGITSTVAASKDDQQIAALLLTLVEGLVCQPMVFGPEAKFNEAELKLIQPPTARLLSRMGKDAVAKFQALSDPIMLLSGLGMWFMRASSLRAQRVHPTVPAPPRGQAQPTLRPTAPPPPPPPPPPPNGHATEGPLGNDDLAVIVERGAL
jgi:hypothetical protein